MSLAALGLLFAAAVLHAGWNLLVKRAKQKQVFTWWAILVGAVCFLPVLVVNRPLPLQIWPYVAGSAFFEALYFVGLTRAYDIDDFSLVYPLARGAAPALLVVWAALFLGERPRLIGLAGLILVVLGLVIVGGAAWWSQRQLATPSLLHLDLQRYRWRRRTPCSFCPLYSRYPWSQCIAHRARAPATLWVSRGRRRVAHKLAAYHPGRHALGGILWACQICLLVCSRQLRGCRPRNQHCPGSLYW